MTLKVRMRMGRILFRVGLVAGLISCSSASDESSATDGRDGAACSGDGDCVSSVCTSGACVGNGSGAPAGRDCTDDADCGSHSCTDGTCALGSDLPDGTSCTAATECTAGVCSDGVCGEPTVGIGGSSAGGAGAGGSVAGGTGAGGRSAGGSGSGVAGTPSTTTGPRFDGAGEGFLPLTTGCGPDTADLCTGECEGTGGDADTQVVRAPATLCFSGEGDPTPEDPSVVIEQVIERVDGQEYVHIRVTFDPSFTDNTYGEGVPENSGWPQRRGHTFRDLEVSDHTELLLTNGDTDTVMHFKIDLIEADASAPCGAASAGVSGGDGAMLIGDEAHVLAIATSLDRNLGGCGYCDLDACGGDCLVNSPATDSALAPNDEAPDWDYRQVYEAWIDLAAFGDSGFGQAFITYTHSSPAKGPETIEVDPEPCPPDWDTPYCEPGDPRCGGSGTGGASGGGGAGNGGEVGTGGSSSSCPPNEQLFQTAGGDVICTPIPFANYPGMAACPTGWVLDLATEGQYCVPAT